MKKIILSTLWVVIMCQAAAQSYVRIDSSMSYFVYLDYQSWLNSGKPLGVTFKPLSFCNPYYHHRERQLDGDIAQYNYTETGLDIYGLVVKLIINEDPYNLQPRTRGLFPDEYLYLFEATPDTFQQVGKLTINVFDSAVCGNMTGAWSNGVNFDCNQTFGPQGDSNSRCYYRFYFDKPIHVEDSFYVGISNNMYLWSELTGRWVLNGRPEGEEPPRPLFHQIGVMTTLANYQNDSAGVGWGEECSLPYMKQKIRWGVDSTFWYYNFQAEGNFHFPPHQWVPTQARDFWMVFPIIKVYDTIWTVDTPACLPVTGFSLMSRFGDTIMLRWNADLDHSEYQVTFYPEGTDPDSGTWVNCTTTRMRHVDTVLNGAVMEARVRTVCRELDTLRYSEWSDPVQWQSRNAAIPPLIEQGTLADGVCLMPNPASDKVVILSNYLVNAVEVFNANGTPCLSATPQAFATSLNVADWPKGIYLVTVRTTLGNVTKKLLVE